MKTFPWKLVLVGILLGFSLSKIGFSSWGEVHRMFVFDDLRLTASFGFGVALLATVWATTQKRFGPLPPRNVHPGTLAGGVVFGVGWALCGACPSISLVQLGEGQFGALAILAGIFGGNWSYALLHERYFRWATSSCVDQ